MGIHTNGGTKLTLRIVFFAALWFFAFIIPWWLIFILASILVFTQILSVELIVLGLLLDFFLLDTQSGIFGLFYSIFFFVIVVISLVFRLSQKRNET
jgi:hypothetical protein